MCRSCIPAFLAFHSLEGLFFFFLITNVSWFGFFCSQVGVLFVITGAWGIPLLGPPLKKYRDLLACLYLNCKCASRPCCFAEDLQVPCLFSRNTHREAVAVWNAGAAILTQLKKKGWADSPSGTQLLPATAGDIPCRERKICHPFCSPPAGTAPDFIGAAGRRQY